MNVNNECLHIFQTFHKKILSMYLAGWGVGGRIRIPIMDTECSKSADVSHAICIMKPISSVLSAFMTKRIQLRRHDKAYPMKASWADFKLVNTFPLVDILSTTLEHIPFQVFGAQGQ
jgi:hypothetical protein